MKTDASLPIFSSDLFDWKRGVGYTSLSRLELQTFPRDGFRVRSAQTNAIRLFRTDDVQMEANDFYDGEGYAFISDESIRIHVWF